MEVWVNKCKVLFSVLEIVLTDFYKSLIPENKFRRFWDTFSNILKKGISIFDNTLIFFAYSCELFIFLFKNAINIVSPMWWWHIEQIHIKWREKNSSKGKFFKIFFSGDIFCLNTVFIASFFFPPRELLDTYPSFFPSSIKKTSSTQGEWIICQMSLAEEVNSFEYMGLSRSIVAIDICLLSQSVENFLRSSKTIKWKSSKHTYSECIIHERTIWCAAFFCWLQARSLSGSSSSWMTVSGRRESVSLPLRDHPSTVPVSIFASVSKESMTLSILRVPHLRAVSFARCVICACVRDIFYYNMPVLYKNMPKIKEIHDRLIKNPSEYTNIRFLVAKRVFITIATLYFLSFLFTVWGYYFWFITIDTLSLITYHLYSLLIIGFVWFWFSIAEYVVALYAPHHNWVPYFVLCILFIFGSLAFYVHLSPIFS